MPKNLTVAMIRRAVKKLRKSAIAPVRGNYICLLKPEVTKSSKRKQGVSSAPQSPLKWPSARRGRVTRLFTVDSNPRARSGKARRAQERARTEFHKFWTDCPAC